MKTPGDESAAENLRHIAYYCWGAPGFNAGNFPATWYDGSAMDDDKYIALSHIILADAVLMKVAKLCMVVILHLKTGHIRMYLGLIRPENLLMKTLQDLNLHEFPDVIPVLADVLLNETVPVGVYS